MRSKTERYGKRAASKPTLLSGGNPQVAKGDGDGRVQIYIEAIPDWKRDVGRRLDELIVHTIADVRKAVRWNSAFYGTEKHGWFLSAHCYAKYVKVAFFNGLALRPVPPVESKTGDTRYFHVYEDDRIDEVLLASWIRQAAERRGWTGFR